MIIVTAATARELHVFGLHVQFAQPRPMTNVRFSVSAQNNTTVVFCGPVCAFVLEFLSLLQNRLMSQPFSSS
jgi:hypothetical protein